MTNRFYAEGKHRAARVEELFGAIAARYDLLNDIQSLGLHRFWKQRLIRLSQVQAGSTALDVCCGTGDIAFRLARQGAQVTGLDFSESMLAVARQRWVKSSLRSGAMRPEAGPNPAGSPHFIHGDAMQLPFPDDQFDLVTVGYGLRNLKDWQVGLSEMVRVAKPGGRVLVLDFGKPRNGLVRATYFLYLRLMVPCFGFLFCGNASAYAYILESLHHYPAQEGVAQAMQQMGLRGIEVRNQLVGMMSINVGVKV